MSVDPTLEAQNDCSSFKSVYRAIVTPHTFACAADHREHPLNLVDEPLGSNAALPDVVAIWWLRSMIEAILMAWPSMVESN